MNFMFEIFAMILFIPLLILGQTDLPNSKNFDKAEKNQTRTKKGTPGLKYWQNRTSYNITAEVIPSGKKLIGSEIITFKNNSPDTLDHLVMHIYQDLYKKGTPKDDNIHIDDIHSGVKIESVKVKEKQIAELQSDKTLLMIDLKDSILPSEIISVEVKWNFTIPTKSDIRMGGKDSTSFFLGHWFPRIAVYDDLKGWDLNIHSGGKEFYYDIGDFEYSVKVPQSYFVWGTGLLQNAEKVLSKNIFEKFNRAQKSDSIIHIVRPEDFKRGEKLTKDNTWKFKAKNVSDVAFGISDHFLWDATSTKIAENRIFVESAYPSESEDFKEVVRLAKKSIKYLSTELPGVPYPFPKVAVFNGKNGKSGMEYPMIANNPSADNFGRTVDVTVHEISHNYFPFYVLTNETEHAWMDEAFASMIPHQYQKETGPSLNRLLRYTGYVSKWANTDRNISTNTNSNLVKGKISAFNFYAKPSVALYVLQDMLGKELFKKCMITYIETWKNKHPAPEDFFNIVNATADKNLNWFWKSWFYEKRYPDLSIHKLESIDNSHEITIKSIGDLPVPIKLNITFSDLTTTNLNQTAAVWEKNSQYVFTVKSDQKIKSIKLGNDNIPDTDSSNNFYEVK